MKFIHLLSVLALAAAWGAAHALPVDSTHPLPTPASLAPARSVPPWLVEAAVDGAEPADAVAPHGSVCAAEDPHAGVYPMVEPADDEDPYRQVGLAPAPAVPVEKVERSRAANGHRVEEIYAGREQLAGNQVRVRGTIVKLNEGILGKTYLHLRDGSGSAERSDDDLTATSIEAFELGETVELEGQLAIDQDVGAGYVYPALLTRATRVGR